MKIKALLSLITLSLSLNIWALNLPVIIKDYRGNGDVKTKAILRNLLINNVNNSTNSIFNKIKRSSIGFTLGLTSHIALEKYIKYRENNLSSVIINNGIVDYDTKNIWHATKYIAPILVTFISEKLIKYRQNNKHNYLALKDLIVNWDKYKPNIDVKLHYYFEDLVKIYKNNPEIIKKYSTKIVQEIKSVI